MHLFPSSIKNCFHERISINIASVALRKTLCALAPLLGEKDHKAVYLSSFQELLSHVDYL